MDRDAFLGRLRRRLDEHGPVVNLAHPLPEATGVPRPGYPAPADPVDALARSAAAKGWNVRRDLSLESLLDEVVTAHGAGSAVCSRDAAELGAAEVLAGLGVEVADYDGASAAARVDLAVTGVVCAVAATASVVLSSAGAGGRTASLLPPVHVALVRPGQVVATPGDVWRSLDAHFPAACPPNSCSRRARAGRPTSSSP